MAGSDVPQFTPLQITRMQQLNSKILASIEPKLHEWIDKYGEQHGDLRYFQLPYSEPEPYEDDYHAAEPIHFSSHMIGENADGKPFRIQGIYLNSPKIDTIPTFIHPVPAKAVFDSMHYALIYAKREWDKKAETPAEHALREEFMTFYTDMSQQINSELNSILQLTPTADNEFTHDAKYQIAKKIIHIRTYPPNNSGWISYAIGSGTFPQPLTALNHLINLTAPKQERDIE